MAAACFCCVGREPARRPGPRRPIALKDRSSFASWVQLIPSDRSWRRSVNARTLVSPTTGTALQLVVSHAPGPSARIAKAVARWHAQGIGLIAKGLAGVRDA